jgi:hypothetical protein
MAPIIRARTERESVSQQRGLGTATIWEFSGLVDDPAERVEGGVRAGDEHWRRRDAVP